MFGFALLFIFVSGFTLILVLFLALLCFKFWDFCFEVFIYDFAFIFVLRVLFSILCLALLFIFCFWLYFALIVIVALVYLQFTVYAEIILQIMVTNEVKTLWCSDKRHFFDIPWTLLLQRTQIIHFCAWKNEHHKTILSKAKPICCCILAKLFLCLKNIANE